MEIAAHLFVTPAIRKGIALVIPIALMVSMYWCYQTFSHRYSFPLSYLLGYIVYWLFWCILIPIILVGGIKPLLALFQPFPTFGDLSWRTHLLLWLPVIFPLVFIFIPRIGKTNLNILVVSILLGIVIGLTEEILWRGVYMRLFPGNIWLNLIYPSVMFALWHIAPQSVVANRMPGGAFAFVTYALVLGLFYGITVYHTKSIAWSTIAHIIHDTLGLGGFAYAVWLIHSG